MRRAVCSIRHETHYQANQFVAGLGRAGFRVSLTPTSRPSREDVLLVWNRHGMRNIIARRYEQAGATVIVAENGFIGRAPCGGKMYALALGHHNGLGSWRVGEADRFKTLGVELKPWRATGENILILAQRGIGEPGVAMPRDWAATVHRRLSRVTSRPIRLRAHPGLLRTPLEPELENVHAVVTWASGAAIKAIAAGIPCFHELPGWIGAGAARLGIDKIEKPFLGDRTEMFHRLAWAQWSADEIASGEPFKWLLASPSMK